MIKKVETNSLLKQTAALGNYLDAMLRDATQVASEAAEQTVDIEPQESALLSEVAIEVIKLENDEPTKLEITEKNDSLIGINISDNQAVDVEQEQNKPANHLEVGQFPIQCLMFRVGENLLSLPLIQLNGVVPWTDDLTQLPQSPNWMLGLLKHRECNLRVLDSSKVLGIPAIKGQAPGHILVLSDSQWAISCDILEDVVTLEYNDIQWHQASDNTVSLGTIRKTLAYLLSSSGIIKSLKVPDES